MATKSPDAFRTISEVAEWLDTPAHVLRFWESKFSQIKPVKRAGGRRYYRPTDMMLLGGLKRLLHENGMTIRGAQKLLREEGVKHVCALSQPLDFDADADIDLSSDDFEDVTGAEPVEEAPVEVRGFAPPGLNVDIADDVPEEEDDMDGTMDVPDEASPVMPSFSTARVGEDPASESEATAPELPFGATEATGAPEAPAPPEEGAPVLILDAAQSVEPVPEGPAPDADPDLPTPDIPPEAEYEPEPAPEPSASLDVDLLLKTGALQEAFTKASGADPDKLAPIVVRLIALRDRLTGSGT
ncbi:MAG: MerR family transcriptional regulator [Pseudomonadota bacterium]